MDFLQVYALFYVIIIDEQQEIFLMPVSRISKRRDLKFISDRIVYEVYIVAQMILGFLYE
jgi:hypothetical protein